MKITDDQQTNSVPLSTTIITLNEEKNITRCIDSVARISDEILVIDSFSTDATSDICQKKGVRFLKHHFKGYVEQKNYALKVAKYDHILSLDADECLEEKTIAVIEKIKRNWQYDAYSFKRLTNYCGKWVYHCGWYPDRKTRLFDKRKARWGGVYLHEKIVFLEGGITFPLDVNILHYSVSSISFHADAINRYSEIASKELLKQKKNIYFLKDIFFNPILTFIKKYFIRLGLLDGYYGFIICTLSAYYNFLKYAKAWRLQENKKKE